MKNNTKKYHQGFTLAEVLTVVVIIGVLMGVTIKMSIGSAEQKENNLHLTTFSFYSKVETAFRQILTYKTRNNDIARVNHIKGNSASMDLRDAFLNYLDGERSSCAKLKGTFDHSIESEDNGPIYEEEDTEAPDNVLACAEVVPGIIAGFFLDKSCSTTVIHSGYFERPELDKNGNPIVNATSSTGNCGYIVYHTKDSTGKFAVDEFAIAFGHSRTR